MRTEHGWGAQGCQLRDTQATADPQLSFIHFPSTELVRPQISMWVEPKDTWGHTDDLLGDPKSEAIHACIFIMVAIVRAPGALPAVPQTSLCAHTIHIVQPDVPRA